MAASYSKANGEVESVIVLFDHTDVYAKDDQEISFVAMAVHELRTPLTIMRGYIEVFEDELGPTLEPELKDFMHKMNASAQQLTAFVSNILNVARVEENQLTLTLQKQSLKDILTSSVADLELRARVHGKHIELTVPDNLPPIAADRISLQEIINNLVDNAIKYSGKSDKIVISAQPTADMIQIDVQDFGVGIPDGVVPRLFDKFYRSHRSKVQIGGTGLGLYLCKALVTAHGGNIWVKTHEGEGSIFSFTLEPYSEAKHGAEAKNQEGITRGAHGWIKNHSMYRN
jgi:signal transduction histidine kinase